jgi:hypothetical protein
VTAGGLKILILDFMLNLTVSVTSHGKECVKKENVVDAEKTWWCGGFDRKIMKTIEKKACEMNRKLDTKILHC